MAWKLGGVAVPLALEPVTCSSSGDNSDSATAEPTCSEFAITSEAAGESILRDDLIESSSPYKRNSRR